MLTSGIAIFNNDLDQRSRCTPQKDIQVRKLGYGLLTAISLLAAGSASAATTFDFSYTTNGAGGGRGNSITVVGKLFGEQIGSTSSYLITGATGTRTASLGFTPFDITGIANAGTIHGNDNILQFFAPKAAGAVNFYFASTNGIAFTTDLGPSPVDIFSTAARPQTMTAQETYTTTGRNPTTFTSNSFTFTVTQAVAAVPEPATWAMMLAGFGMVGAGLRSRKRQSVRVTYA